MKPVIELPGASHLDQIRPTTLNPDLVREIRFRYSEGETVQNLAVLYSVGLNTIRDVVSYRTWPLVTGDPPNAGSLIRRLSKTETALHALGALNRGRAAKEERGEP